MRYIKNVSVCFSQLRGVDLRCQNSCSGVLCRMRGNDQKKNASLESSVMRRNHSCRREMLHTPTPQDTSSQLRKRSNATPQNTLLHCQLPSASSPDWLPVRLSPFQTYTNTHKHTHAKKHLIDAVSHITQVRSWESSKKSTLIGAAMAKYLPLVSL